jgi:hypothetical protein
MATRDLGSIQVEDGRITPDAPQVDVLGGILSGVAEVVEGVGTQQVLKKGEEFGEITDEALSDALSPAPAEPAETQTFQVSEDAEANKLMETIRGLETKVNQTSGSTRANVQLRLRQSMEDLRRKWPALAPQLSAELRRFEANDPEFAALGVLEIENASFNKMAAKELQDIKDFAYKPIQAGGLGMVPQRQKFGSKEFAEAYSHKSRVLEARNENTNYLLALQSQDDVSARDNALAFESWVSGETAGIRLEIADALDQSREAAKAAANPTSPQAAEKLILWNTPGGGKDQALSDIDNTMLSLTTMFENQFPINQRGTEAFAAAKARFDSEMGALSSYREGVDTGDLTLMQSYETWDTYQNIKFERAQPTIVEQGRVLERVVPLLEAMQGNFGAKDKLIRNDISEYINTSLQGYLGRSSGFAQIDGLPAGSSQREILNHTRSVRGQNPNRYGSAQLSASGTQTGANMDLRLGTDPGLLNLATKGDNAMSPTVAAEQYIARASYLDDLRLSGEVPPDALRDTVVLMGADGLVEQANIARQGAYPDAPLAAADVAADLVRDYEPQRRAQYNRFKTTDLGGGVTVADVILVDTDEVKNGKVRFELDQERLIKMLDVTVPESTQASLDVLDLGGGRVVQAARARVAAKNKALEVVAAMNKAVNEDLRALATVETLRRGEEEIDFERSWNESQFNRDFGELEDGNP